LLAVVSPVICTGSYLTDDDWSSVKWRCQIRCLQVTYTGRVFEANLQATRQSQLTPSRAYGGVIA